jgi:hypothetical protein
MSLTALGMCSKAAIIAGPFADNAGAWAWVDRHYADFKRLSRLVPGGVKDRTAADLNAIRLIVKTELLAALERMMPQIAAVLGEACPSTDEGIPDD